MQTPPIDPNQSLRELAIRVPAAVRVLSRHHLDFCCGGAQTLAAACEKAQLNPALVVDELVSAASLALAPSAAIQWTERPLDEFVQHILDRHHVPLPGHLESVVTLAARVLRAHGDKDTRLPRLLVVVTQLRDELLEHMQKEEEVVFPWISAGNGRTAGAPISVLHHEHESCGRLLDEAARLTDDFQPPAGACTSWRALLGELEHLDLDLRQHIHLENNILFPRALAE